jgi:iron uptake system component EfeO
MFDASNTDRKEIGVALRKGRGAIVTVIAIAALGLAACSSDGSGSADPDPSGGTTTTTEGGASTLAFRLTDAGCDPAVTEVAAGPVNFEVTGQSGAVTELEVLDGSSIIGEVENLASGLSGSFSLRLDPGEYTLYCPGGETERGTLTVTGTVATGGSASEQEQIAVDRYLAFVQQQADLLVDRTGRFVEAVQAGDVAQAQELFAWARIPYESIEPIAESFGDLDPAIDAREGDVPEQDWGGFHRIEQALWVDGTTEGMDEIAEQLLADVTTLRDRIAGIEVDVVQIANGSTELLNEVSASKITGEEDRYSHTDLIDFEANLNGSEAAFRAVAPLLEEADPDLKADIEQRFQEVRDALAVYGSGTEYVLYTDLTPADTQALSRAIDTLAEPLSQVASTIVA